MIHPPAAKRQSRKARSRPSSSRSLCVGAAKGRTATGRCIRVRRVPRVGDRPITVRSRGDSHRARRVSLAMKSSCCPIRSVWPKVGSCADRLPTTQGTRPKGSVRARPDHVVIAQHLDALTAVHDPKPCVNDPVVGAPVPLRTATATLILEPNSTGIVDERVARRTRPIRSQNTTVSECAAGSSAQTHFPVGVRSIPQRFATVWTTPSPWPNPERSQVRRTPGVSESCTSTYRCAAITRIATVHMPPL